MPDNNAYLRLLEQAQQVAGGVDDAIAELIRERGEIDLQLAALRRIQRAFASPTQQVKDRPKRMGAVQGRQRRQRGRSLSPAQLQIADYFIAHPDDGHTVPDLAEVTGLTETTVYNAMNRLRELELVGRAERVASPHATGAGRQVWRILDETAMAKVASIRPAELEVDDDAVA